MIVSIKKCKLKKLSFIKNKITFTSASTRGVKTSSDTEDFLGFSGGVVELTLGIGCEVATLGVLGPATTWVGSTII